MIPPPFVCSPTLDPPLTTFHAPHTGDAGTPLTPDSDVVVESVLSGAASAGRIGEFNSNELERDDRDGTTPFDAAVGVLFCVRAGTVLGVRVTPWVLSSGGVAVCRSGGELLTDPTAAAA